MFDNLFSIFGAIPTTFALLCVLGVLAAFVVAANSPSSSRPHSLR